MIRIDSQQAFQQALADLPLKKQREIGARFIGNVLDLTTDPRFRNVVTLLDKPDLTAEELLDGYRSMHAMYVQTHPRSDLSQLNYARQAEHFIAEACLICLSPVYEQTKVHHLAQKAAMYCCMARTLRRDQARRGGPAADPGRANARQRDPGPVPAAVGIPEWRVTNRDTAREGCPPRDPSKPGDPGPHWVRRFWSTEA